MVTVNFNFSVLKFQREGLIRLSTETVNFALIDRRVY